MFGQLHRGTVDIKRGTEFQMGKSLACGRSSCIAYTQGQGGVSTLILSHFQTLLRLIKLGTDPVPDGIKIAMTVQKDRRGESMGSPSLATVTASCALTMREEEKRAKHLVEMTTTLTAKRRRVLPLGDYMCILARTLEVL